MPHALLAVLCLCALPHAADERVDSAVARSVELLLAKQESLPGNDVSDEWPYEGVYRVRGEIPVGYRVGGTAIAAWSLLEAPQYAQSEDVREAVERATAFVLETLDDELMASGFLGSYDVRGWGHTYALQFLLTLRAKKCVPEAFHEEVDTKITRLVETLQETEIVESGGWNYSRRGGKDQPAGASPFMTAPTVLALWQARAQGEAVDQGTLDRALDVLAAGRLEHGSFGYSTGQNSTLPGGIARTPISETVLHLAGRSSVEDIEKAVADFFEHWNELEVRRQKTGTHVAPHGVAPYYFFYGHYYASVAIEMLPAEARPRWRTRYLETLFSVREPSGGWNDRVFPRSEAFGTSMSLLSLLEPRRARPRATEAAARIK